jgi:hypothetical protein
MGAHHHLFAAAGRERRALDLALAPSERRTVEIELAPLRAPAKAAPPPGTLTVRTIPWSKVYEGTRLLGTTPLAGVPLSAGRHTITFVNPDRPTVTRAVAIRSGEEARLSVELRR